ncbi:HNH endonuclease [Vibrio gigantis]|uniref:HNH endonuclease n=1 Tax=Vibrio gigantis TaxID=296199 RepID=UPI0035A71491
MKNLDDFKVKPNEYKDWIDKVTSSKKVKRLQLKDLEEELLKEYSKYETRVTAYRNKLPDSDFMSDHEMLVDFYEKPPVELNTLLLERRHDHGLSECPFCGKPVSPGTLDHFIPKSDWPQFSIFQNNLVPQCRDCAPIKGDDYHCKSKGHAIFISPIYSKLLSMISFDIIIDFNESKRSIEIQTNIILPSNITAKNERRLISHLQALNTGKRIETYSLRTIKRWEKMLKVSDFDISSALQTRIDEKEPTERSKDWKTALFKGMLDNKELLNHLKTLRGINMKPIKKPKHTRRISL